jgi:hypothetical protein
MYEHDAPRAVHHFSETCLIDAPELRHAGAATIRATLPSFIATHTSAFRMDFGRPAALTPQLFPDILV